MTQGTRSHTITCMNVNSVHIQCILHVIEILFYDISGRILFQGVLHSINAEIVGDKTDIPSISVSMLLYRLRVELHVTVTRILRFCYLEKLLVSLLYFGILVAFESVVFFKQSAHEFVILIPDEILGKCRVDTTGILLNHSDIGIVADVLVVSFATSVGNEDLLPL